MYAIKICVVLYLRTSHEVDYSCLRIAGSFYKSLLFCWCIKLTTANEKGYTA